MIYGSRIELLRCVSWEMPCSFARVYPCHAPPSGVGGDQTRRAPAQENAIILPELEALLATRDDSPEGIRDRALLCYGLALGAHPYIYRHHGSA